MRFWQLFSRTSQKRSEVDVEQPLTVAPSSSSDIDRVCAFLRLNDVPRELAEASGVPFMNLLRIAMDSSTYKSSPRAWKSPLGWPLNQVVVSPEHKILYCPIGKNACTFLKKQMALLAQPADLDVIVQDIHLLTDHVNTGLLLGDYPEDEARALMATPDAFRFAIFRDPMDRLLSAYMEKFVVNRTTPGNVVHTATLLPGVQAGKGMEVPDYDLGITFREFIDAVVSTTNLGLDAHWRPQATYLKGMQYDRIYLFDQMETLLRELEQRSGIQLDRQPQNVTGSGKGEFVEKAYDLEPKILKSIARLNRDSFFPPELQAKVEGYFQQDYEVIAQHKQEPKL